VSTLDEIIKEKERIGGALARVDAQREKLTSQLSELEATERVLARYRQGERATKLGAVRGSTAARQAPAPSRSRGRQSTVTKPARGRRSSQTLGDQVLALANGRTQQEIAAACKGARPNHVGVAIARHKRAGRIEERDGRLYATQAIEATQNAAG
jgi:hypothetical protein